MTLPSPIIHPPRGELPVLLSVPHSGRDYPEWLVALASQGKASLTTLESMLSTLHPSDQSIVNEVMNQSLAQGEAFQIEFRVIRPDGSIRWMSGQGQTYLDGSGAASQRRRQLWLPHG